jgi:hypothetical protein
MLTITSRKGAAWTSKAERHLRRAGIGPHRAQPAPASAEHGADAVQRARRAGRIGAVAAVHQHAMGVAAEQLVVERQVARRGFVGAIQTAGQPARCRHARQRVAGHGAGPIGAREFDF